MPVKGFDDSKNKKDVYTKEEMDKKIGNYSYGTEAPTGGKDGDTYDQYFIAEEG